MKFLFYLIFIAVSQISFGQVTQCKSESNWFFGKSQTVTGASSGNVMHMEFSCPTGALMSISPVTPGVNYGFEGTAVVNDLSTGAWKMYTDGDNVLFPSLPTITNLGGHASSTQSVALCSVYACPNDSFYVFTNPTGGGSTFGVINFATVNLNGVITASQPLPLPSSIQVGGAVNLVHGEGMKIIPSKASPNNYWLITRLLKSGGSSATDAIVVYDISPAGISINQVFDASMDNNTNISNSIFSLAYTTFNHNSENGIITIADANTTKSICSFAFDQQTGMLSGTAQNIISLSPSGAYAVEFSPDNNLMYYSNYGTGQVFTFSLSTGAHTQVIFNNSGSNRRAAGIRLAPDGNIYALTYSTSNWSVFNSRLWQITNPNSPTPTGTSLQDFPNWLMGNLPEFIELPEVNLSLGTSYVCPGDSTVLSLASSFSSVLVDSVNWFLNSQIIPSLSDTSLWASQPGTYYSEVVLQGGCTYISDTILLNSSDEMSFSLNNYTCTQDSVYLQVNICNEGFDPLSQYITYGFYDQSLYSSASNQLVYDSVLVNLSSFSCDSVIVSLPAFSGSIYLAGNILPNVNSPISVSNYPWNVPECDFINNIDSIEVCCAQQININDTTVCIGDEVVIMVPNTQSSNYVWSSNIYLTDTLSLEDTLVFTGTTVGSTYIYIQESSVYCTIVDSVLIQTVPNPSIDAGADFTACSGDLVTLTANNQNGANVIWSNSVVDGVPFVINTSSQYIVTADLNGCVSFDSINISVLSSPILTLPSDTNLCYGEEYILNVLFGINDSLSILPSGISIGDTIQFPIGINEIYFQSNNAYCIAEDTLTVNVWEYPIITGLNDSTICEGESITLNAIINPANSNVTWSSSVINNVPFLPNLGMNQYEVVADNNGCFSLDTVSIFVNELPEIVSSINNPTFCDSVGGSVLLEGIGNQPISFYLNQNLVNNFVDNLGPGSYNIEAVDANGCVATETITLLGFNSSYANFEFNPSQDILIEQLVNFFSLTNGAQSYNWTVNGNGVTNFTDSSFTFSFHQPGEYQICLEAFFEPNCSDITCSTIIVNDELYVYVPNSFTPDGQSLNNFFAPVFSRPENVLDYQIQIYDRWGEIIFESNDVFGYWDGTYMGKIVQDGTYIWKMKYTESLSSEEKSLVGHINVLK